MDAQIWAVVKDPGGTNAVMPVVAKLREFGHSVFVIANGKAVELPQEERVSYESAEEVIKNHKAPRVLITSMCSRGGVGRDLVPLLRDKAKTIAIQDSWGAVLWNHWSHPLYRPDFITVNDFVGADIVQQAWPEYPRDRIVLTGYPALDKYFAYDTQKEAENVRRMLGLKNRAIILFGGQGDKTSHAIEQTIKALNMINEDIYFIPRPHPRTKDNFQKEMIPWQKAIEKIRGKTRLIVDYFSQVEIQSLIAASTVVVSMFSNVLVDAVALRKQNISILYPNEGMKLYCEEVQGVKEFPLVSLGCSAKASNLSELTVCLRKALRGELSLQSAQEKNFRLDGKNAERATKFIESLLHLH